MTKTTIRLGYIAAVPLLFAALMISAPAHADTAPSCLDAPLGSEIAVNNDQVLNWKKSTPNQYLSRAHVAGIIDHVYPNRNGHAHFSIRLGNTANETLEVAYSLSFGGVPPLTPGMQVEACGDYITSTAPGGGYPASPDGALIHWVHQSDSHKHASGFMLINGTLYGTFNHGGGNRH